MDGGGPIERATARLGREGEEAALAWYLRRGYSLVARNWRCGLGEIDLVLARAGELVVCEVKTRRGDAYGAPFEAVTWRKRRKLESLAEAFLATAGMGAAAVRFDVASVVLGGTRDREARIHVYEHAF